MTDTPQQQSQYFTALSIETPRRGHRVLTYGILLLALPFLLAAANPIWLNNSPGDWDVWMYYGYFNHLFQFSDQYIWPANSYIGTRISYFLPGYIIYQVFGDDLYRYVFNIGVLYTTIVFSYYYIIRKYLPLTAATAATVLIAMDYFLLRSIGWDYVDKCVAAYEALTFAFLTMAASSRRPWLATIGAGFTAASMVFVHLASVLLFPIFFLYSAFVVQRAASVRDWRKHLLHVLLFGGLGAALAQLVFGSLIVALRGAEFFFILRQTNVVVSNIGGWNTPISVLFTTGYWITVHIAAFVGACLALFAAWLRPADSPFTRFESFWLWTSAIGYAILFFCEIEGYLWLFSRDGMHSTIFIPFAMITFGILLFRNPFPGLVAITAAVAVGSVLLRLDIGNGEGLSSFLKISVPILGIAGGVLLAVAFIFSRRSVTLTILVALGVLNGFNRWHFTDDRVTRSTHAKIASETQGKLPNIAFDQKDPQINQISGILASFTDRALVASRNTYPVFRNDMKQGDVVVVISSLETNVADAQSALQRYVREAAITDSFRAGNVWVHMFTVSAGQ